MTFDWSGVVQAVIISIPAWLAWRDAHRAHLVAKDTKEEVAKVVDKVTVVEKSVNGILDKRVALAHDLGTAEGTAVGLEQGRAESKEKP